MSRIGNAIITIPAQVTLEKKEHMIMVKGPKGTLTVVVPTGIDVAIDGTSVKLSQSTTDGDMKSLHGLTRTHIANAVVGVTTGWEKKLEMIGVGYRASGSGKQITLNVGFSHPVVFSGGDDISFTVADNTKISVMGIDKKNVGEAAARLRAIKPPEPYKGKGIRYEGEVVRKKAGKAVKAAGAAS